jgi:hypothetical protein
MIPQTGVKMIAAVDPLPNVLVKNRMLWWTLNRLKKIFVKP